MAYRAGARVKNLAYIQFHPTALATKSDRPFLITEAMRGEGGVILDDEGLRKWQLQCKKEGAIISPEPFSFTLKHSQLGSMATRDIVARAIDKQLKITGKTHVYLVTSHLDEKLLNSHFPTIRARLETHGLKLGYDPLPISPAAHYAVGGLEVDEIGRPYNRENGDIYPRLYAIGEVACTGMHGANRLASNSLLEAVVYAYRAAEHIISNPPEKYQQKLPNWRADGLHTLSEHGPVVHDKNELRQTMSQEVGIVRRFSRLNRAARRLELLGQEVNRIWIESIPTRPIIELRNLTLVGQLVTKDAIARTENCGLHFNQDLIKE
jgi:L-aspartate oxidase